MFLLSFPIILALLRATYLLTNTTVFDFKNGFNEQELFAIYHDTQSTKVFDPMTFEEERSHINPWSDIEKCIFLDRFLQHPKDFKKIASFLKNKSTRDCVAFYYDSKQSNTANIYPGRLEKCTCAIRFMRGPR